MNEIEYADQRVKHFAELISKTLLQWAQESRQRQAAEAYRDAAEYIQKAAGIKPLSGKPWGR
jgi:hypothetical protein